MNEMGIQKPPLAQYCTVSIWWVSDPAFPEQSGNKLQRLQFFFFFFIQLNLFR